MRRLRRTWAQRLICSRLYRCDTCRTNVRWPHKKVRAIPNRLGWLFALHTTCVGCRGTAVRAVQAYRADVSGRTMFEAVQQWVESCRYRCVRCNLSYFDWRPTTSQRRSHQRVHKGHPTLPPSKRAPDLTRRNIPAPELPPRVTIRVR